MHQSYFSWITGARIVNEKSRSCGRGWAPFTTPIFNNTPCRRQLPLICDSFLSYFHIASLRRWLYRGMYNTLVSAEGGSKNILEISEHWCFSIVTKLINFAPVAETKKLRQTYRHTNGSFSVRLPRKFDFLPEIHRRQLRISPGFSI